MSNSPQTYEMRDFEEVEVNLIAGSGDTQNNNTSCRIDIGQEDASCCNDRHHRTLAIWSIICGISCIGIKALIYSVKAKYADNEARAAEFSKQAKKFGIISIVTWVSCLVAVPVLLVALSYLLTLRD